MRFQYYTENLIFLIKFWESSLMQLIYFSCICILYYKKNGNSSAKRKLQIYTQNLTLKAKHKQNIMHYMRLFWCIYVYRIYINWKCKLVCFILLAFCNKFSLAFLVRYSTLNSSSSSSSRLCALVHFKLKYLEIKWYEENAARRVS